MWRFLEGLWASRGMVGDDRKDEVYRITQEEFEEPIQDAYVESISQLSYAELDDKYNPGPTLPDGGVNFECHCVGHLVASPCGHEFREAIRCQKAAGETALDDGACAEEFMNFMKCVIRTECFKSRRDENEDEEEKTPEGETTEQEEVSKSSEGSTNTTNSVT